MLVDQYWSWFIVWVFSFAVHAHAGDLQVYCHMNVGSEQVVLPRFSECANSVSRWMSSNQLKLNPELSWLHNCHRQLSFVGDDIVIFGYRIAQVPAVRNLRGNAE